MPGKTLKEGHTSAEAKNVFAKILEFRLINLTNSNHRLKKELETGSLDSIMPASFNVAVDVIKLTQELNRIPHHKKPFLNMIDAQLNTADLLHQEVKSKQERAIQALEHTLVQILKHISEGDRQKGWSWKNRFIDAKKDDYHTQKLQMLAHLQQFIASGKNHEWLLNIQNFKQLAGLVQSVCKLERSTFASTSKNGTHSLDEFIVLYSKYNPLTPVGLDDVIKEILKEDEIDQEKLDDYLNVLPHKNSLK